MRDLRPISGKSGTTGSNKSKNRRRTPKPGEFEIDRTYRLQYRDQIKNYFPGLFEMIELADGRRSERRRCRLARVNFGGNVSQNLP